MEWSAAYHLEAVDDEIEVPKPVVQDWLLFAWRCWHALDADRPWYGGGLGPMVPGHIPWATLRGYAEHHDMSGGDFSALVVYIRAMDAVYIGHVLAKVKRS